MAAPASTSAPAHRNTRCGESAGCCEESRAAEEESRDQGGAGRTESLVALMGSTALQ